MSRQWVSRVALAAAAAGILLVGTSLWFLRPAHVKTLVERGLSRHLRLTATIGELSVQFVPRPRVVGGHMALRIPGRTDLPPFISIDRFTVDVGLLSMIRKHVDTVHADGLRISVPPGDSRDGLTAPNTDDPSGLLRKVVIDHFVTHDAELRFVRRNPDDTPLAFAIQSLTVDTVGFDGEMPFVATLTNPIPKGLIAAHGFIGPFVAGDVADTRLSGDYTFEHADLATINGIGGTLESTGHFSGSLTAIAAEGEARVPDFSLDLGGNPVPLTAAFRALINGTDGTTTLREVDATLRRTPIRVTGAIANLAGPGRHDVNLAVDVANGRVEDILLLILDTPKPVMTGGVSLTATFRLPPGPGRVRNRVEVSGRFGLTDTHFADEHVQQKVQDLSRRSQGKDESDDIERVVTNLRGRVHLVAGTANLTQIAFQVQGATVALDGRYVLETGALDFRGTLRMDASVSAALGGFKSIFVKPFDRLFRKDGAGAVLPIRISGTRDAPTFGLEMGKVFRK